MRVQTIEGESDRGGEEQPDDTPRCVERCSRVPP
jgi:hypothetical protein